MAIFPDSARDSLNCSIEMIRELKKFNIERMNQGLSSINIDIGLNTGLSMFGMIGGINRIEGTVIGDAVNIASRLENTTKDYGVNLLISEHSFSNIDNIEDYNIRFIDRILVKGKSRPQSIYEVYDSDDLEVVKLKNETKLIFEEALASFHYKHVNVAEILLKKCLDINPMDKPAMAYLDKCRIYNMTGVHKAAKELEQQIDWKTIYKIGHDKIDSQHYNLLNNSINLIKYLECHALDDSYEEIKKMLKFLDKYIIEHFDTEEAIMEKYNYPFLTDQKNQHRRFIKSYTLLKAEIEEFHGSKIYLMFKIQIFLIDWIINHTLNEDKHLGKFLKTV